MGSELAVVPLKLPTTVDDALADWKDYQTLTQKLLDDSDYQGIGDRRFKKKSAWRKYARAFNISTEVTYEEIERDSERFPIFARVRVKATGPNGRHEEADQECHVKERCSETCAEDCSGRGHWAHPGDLPATALTRAKNRAISDLIGAGEVSAEEMDTPRQAAPRKPKPSSAVVDNPVTGIISEVIRKTGPKAGGGTWIRYGIKIGEEIFGTFSKRIAEYADIKRLQGSTVELQWREQNGFKTAESIVAVPDDDNLPEYEVPSDAVDEPGSRG